MSESKRHSKLLSGCMMAVGTVVLAVVAIVVIYIVNNRPANIIVPTPKMPKPNAWDDFERAASLDGGGKNHWGPVSDPDPNHRWTLAEYESFIKDNAPALAALEAGLSKPYLHPPIRGVDEPVYGGQRELGRMVESTGMYYEFIRKLGKAADAYLDGIEFGTMLPKGGNLITAFTGMCISEMSRTKLIKIIPKLSPCELEMVANRLYRIEKKRVPYSDIMIEEGWQQISLWQSVSKELRDPKKLVSEYSSLGSVGSDLPVMFSNKSAMLHESLSFYQSLSAECRRPYTGKSSVRIPRNAMLSDLGPTLCQARLNFVRDDASFVLLKTDVATRRYRAANGRYPDSLSELAPTYLKSEPIDPFGGRPLKYRSLKNGQNFLLYSIGPNMKDDGGTPGQRRGSYKTGDIVAGRC